MPTLTIPQSWPCVRRPCQLPLHKGASGCSRTSAFIDISQKNLRIVPHSPLVRNDTVSFRPFSTTQPTAIRSIPTGFRRCGRGILKGAAFRQRPLSRFLLNVLAETRTLPPEGSAPKVFRRLKCDVKACAFCLAFYQKIKIYPCNLRFFLL